MGNCVASGGTTAVTAAGAGGEDGRRKGRRWKAPREEQLGSVPGRIFSNDGRSRTAAVFTQQGRKGINQDAMLVWDVSHPNLSHLLCPVSLAANGCVLVVDLIHRGRCGNGGGAVDVAGVRRGGGHGAVRGVRRARAARPPGGAQGPRRAAAQAHVRGTRVQGRAGHARRRVEEGLRASLQDHGQGPPLPRHPRLLLQRQYRRHRPQAGTCHWT